MNDMEKKTVELLRMIADKIERREVLSVGYDLEVGKQHGILFGPAITSQVINIRAEVIQ